MKDQAANIGDWGLAGRTRGMGAQADPTRLRQILRALIDNGITYNQRPGSVKVTVSFDTDSCTPDRWGAHFRDRHGMGLARPTRSVVSTFQPFGARKQIPDGTGVSLSISRHLAG